MTNGLLFFWFSWLLWIYVTFVMKKNQIRTLLGFWILLTIGGSSTYVTILGYNLTLSYLILTFGAIIILAQCRRLFYHLFSSLTIMVLYMGVMLWENYFPIWMILSKTFVSPFIIVFITVLITKGFYNRLSITLLGISSGELMYSFILSSYSIREPIGGYTFFDCVMVILFLLIGIEVVHALRAKIRALFHIYKKSFQVLTEEERVN